MSARPKLTSRQIQKMFTTPIVHKKLKMFAGDIFNVKMSFDVPCRCTINMAQLQLVVRREIVRQLNLR